VLLAALAFLGAYAVSSAAGNEEGDSPSSPPVPMRPARAAVAPPPLAAGAPLPDLRRAVRERPSEARPPDIQRTEG
jgi:hypothetical protein